MEYDFLDKMISMEIEINIKVEEGEEYLNKSMKLMLIIRNKFLKSLFKKNLVSKKG